jgi:hypothetical protein
MAERICAELKIHTQIEEEWASPSFPDALPSPLSAAVPRIEPG